MAATYTVGDGKTYSTIQAAIDAIPGDLSGQDVQTVEVYAGGSHEGNGYFYDEWVNALAGFTNPSGSDYISILAMVSHAGLKDTGIIVRVPGNTGAFKGCAYTEIDGFGFTYANDVTASVFGAILVWRDYIKVKNCIVYDVTVTGGSYSFNGIYATFTNITGTEIINCAVINITSYYSVGILAYQGSTTIINCSVRGIWDSGGYSRGISFYQPQAGHTHTAVNCIACDRGTGGAPGDSRDFKEVSPIGTISVTYCISEDNSADDWGGAGNQINKDPVTDIKFVSSSDLHVQAGSCAIDAGIVQAGVTTDFEGDNRGSPGAACDVGADEYVSGLNRHCITDSFFISGGNVSPVTGDFIEA